MTSRSKTVRRPGPPRGGKPPARAGGPPRLDATNLAGLTTLMNPQHLRGGVDLDSAEQAVMGKAGPPPRRTPKADLVQLYTQELNQLADELGINFLDDGGGDDAKSEPPGGPGRPAAPPAAAPRPRNPLRGSAIDDLLGDLDLGSRSSAAASRRPKSSAPPRGGKGPPARGGRPPSTDDSSGGSSSRSSPGSSSSSSSSSSSGSSSGDEEDEDEDEEDEEDEDDDEKGVDDGSVLSNLGKELGIDLAGTRRHGKRRTRVLAAPARGAPAQGDPGRSRLSRLTEEQERRRHINSVMGDMRHETRTSFGVEHERSQDVKASKLEQIGQLRMSLEEEGIDCGGVGDPTMASPVGEIDSVLTILKLKNDRNRYSSLAEEVILGVAEGVETVLDGTREIPVLGWRPDYTGYNNTVCVKLHRMRFETSQVVGNVIQKYSIGPTARIVMELLPSFFLYPRQQRKQRGAPGLHADPAAGGRKGGGGPRVADARGAFSAIRRSDVPDSLSAVADL